MSDELEILGLIKSLYAAIGCPEGWTEFLQALCGVFDANIAFLFSLAAKEDAVDFLAGVRLGTDEAAAGSDVPVEDGSGFAGAGDISKSIVLSGAMAPRPGLPEVDRNFPEWLGREGGYHSLEVVAQRASGVSILTIRRDRSSGSFSRQTRKIFSALGDHLGLALQLQNEQAATAGQSRAIEYAAEYQSSGVVVVDAEAQVLFANRIARDLCAAEDGILIADGRLSAKVKRTDVLLRRLIAETGAARRGTALPDAMISIPRPSGRWPMTVVVSATPREPVPVTSRTPAAILFISDPDAAPSWSVELARRVFSLTQREAELAVRLVAGVSLGDASRQIGISTNTARTHLQNLLRKTNTHSQIQLISLLLTGLPPTINE